MITKVHGENKLNKNINKLKGIYWFRFKLHVNLKQQLLGYLQ